MGGYYALRAAADPRVAACVALDPFYDMYDFATSHMGAAFGALLQEGHQPLSYGSVRISLPSAVTTRVCSNWAVHFLSFVVTVQSSDQMS